MSGKGAAESCVCVETESSLPPPPPQPHPNVQPGRRKILIPTISAVTYNILCEAYVTDRSFPPDTNPKAHLAWEGREGKLLEELGAYAADLLFLQEVQAEAWGEGGDGGSRPGALCPALRAQGYEGTWFWSAPGASLKPRRGAPRVGPALLVRSARFRVRARAAIAFRHARCAADLSGGHEPTAALLAGCRDGAVAVFLEDKTTGATLLAASVHVNWDYRTPDLKVLQVAALMAELRAFWVGAVGGGSGASGLPPLILGGDFNSLPLDRPSNEAPGAPSCGGLPSGAYELLTTGRLAPGHPHHPARQRGGAAGVTFSTAGWGALASARAVAGGRAAAPAACTRPRGAACGQVGAAEPALTTRTTQFEGTLDYIFVSPAHWRVTGVLEDPWVDEKEMDEKESGEGEDEGGTASASHPPTPSLAAFPPTPNQAWPSDHLAVGAILEPL